MAEVPLAEAIAGLRAQLEQAIATGAGERLQFELDSVVLELEVAITSTGRADAKVGLWSVLTLGASADHSKGSVHKLTLTLSPTLADAPPGQKVRVGREGSEFPPAARPDEWDPAEG